MTNDIVDVPADFNSGLIRALQPVRQAFLAQTLQYLLSSGLYDRLDSGLRLGGPATRDYDPARLHGLLDYLLTESVVARDGSWYHLTTLGRSFGAYRAWYELLIGGYGQSLAALPEVLSDGGAYAPRDDAAVGRGSCGISAYDALPLIRSLITGAPTAPDTIADLGCGDGTVLIELSRDCAHAVGADPAASSIVAARKHAAEAGVADRTDFVTAGAEQYLADPERRARRDVCYVFAFALQEVLEQAGRAAVVTLLRQSLEAPGNCLVVVEVAPFVADAGPMTHGLELAYYNPYYLMHTITRQRLEAESFWRGVFIDADAQVADWRTTDPRVDPTGREFGVLLTRAGQA